MAPRNSQPSRKGKKAWRKNIDIKDVSDALEAKRDREVLLGKDSDEAFVIDTAGDYSVSKPSNTLKIADILTNKSKVAPLSWRPRKKVVSTAQKEHLMALAGRSLTTSVRDARLAEEGIDAASDRDIWSDEVPTEESFPPRTSKAAAFKAPSTMSIKPRKLDSTEIDDITSATGAGKSYNPSTEAWQMLLAKEYAPEEKKEIERQAAQAYKERIEYLKATLPDEDAEESGDEEEPVYENEEDRYRLSVNPPTRVKIKDRTTRNRQARHKQRLRDWAELRALKEKLKDIENLEEIEREVTERMKNFKPANSRERKVMGYSKHDVSFKPIEVKLSDELTNDLRSLKPEGNLLYEQMHKLQASGKIEATVEGEARRKYKQRMFTRNSHKY